MDPAAAAKIGGMDRQTRATGFIASTRRAGGPIDIRTEGLSEEQLGQFAKIVEAGPDREKDGVVRWRRIDLKHVIAERFGVDFHPRYVGKLLKKLSFSHTSARPRHPAPDARIVEAFKKSSRAR
jgi:transposase